MVSVQSSQPKVGIRKTRQRTAIVALLADTKNFTSARDIYELLIQREERVGLTTVYRTLQSLAESGAVDVLHMPSGESLYRACNSNHHHHHLVCSECGKTEEIDGGPVEEWAKSVAEKYGYSITGHDAEIYGICSECQRLADQNAES